MNNKSMAILLSILPLFTFAFGEESSETSDNETYYDEGGNELAIPDEYPPEVDFSPDSGEARPGLW